jgi:hypothetical protein
VIIAAGNDENSPNVSELYDCIAPKAKYYLGEASSCLALETEESFRKRQHEPVIHLFAEVAGYACNHTTDEANAKENLASAIQTACKRAGVTPDQIEMVYSCIEEATTLTQDDLKEILPEAKQVQLIERDGNGRAGLANRSAAEAVEAIDCGYCHISMAVASSFGSYTAVVFTEAK